jgi:hypothetical protein
MFADGEVTNTEQVIEICRQVMQHHYAPSTLYADRLYQRSFENAI